ncbi:hypothetical protein GCM10027037_33050 [Mucilaginibacter koreensis]
MKKILLFAVVLLVSAHLKAQQLEDKQLLKADNAISKRAAITLMDTIFNVKPLPKDDLLKTLEKQKAYAALLQNSSTAQAFYSRMPVAKLHSDDPMPIAGRTNSTAFNMPIKKIQLVKPDTAYRTINNSLAFPALNGKVEK